MPLGNLPMMTSLIIVPILETVYFCLSYLHNIFAIKSVPTDEITGFFILSRYLL